MRTRLAIVIAVVTVGSLLPGASSAGNYQPPPGDAWPSWSPDASRIAFLTTRGDGRALVVAASDGSGERRVIENPQAVAVSPDWRWSAYVRYEDGRPRLHVARFDGSEERELATAFTAELVWAPDSRRIAFASPDGLSVVDRDGGSVVRLAERASVPAWSPDGTRLSFASNSPRGLYVVAVAGGAPRRITARVALEAEPAWSSDGERIAFETGATPESARVATIRPDGRGLVILPSRTPPDSLFTWMPDSKRLLLARDFDRAIFLVDARTGRERRLAFGATPAPSPDGSQIAFAAGGECRDRLGIYVASVDGSTSKRVTNDCRIFGTAGDDELSGTYLAEIILGLAGDDRLFASGAYYMGDTLVGGPGDDLLVGEFRADLLRGGDGADVLQGGLSPDELYGGPGSDRLDAGPGRDSVYAQDGERDVIVCGTNRAGLSERDRVWADRADRVAADCEVVHRR